MSHSLSKSINPRCATNKHIICAVTFSHLFFSSFSNMLPTIVAVPGAWHTTASFEPVKKVLTQRGYHFVSQNAPGLYDANGTCQDDAMSLRTKILLPLVDEGKDLVVLMHSYGGMYGSQAVQGLSKKEREQAGKKGGVTALIYVSAVTPIEGKTTLDMMGTDSKNLPSWVDYNVCDSSCLTLVTSETNELYSGNNRLGQIHRG
jgi:hypothetical protein